MACKNSKPCGSYTASPSSFGFSRQCDGSSLQIYQAFMECLPTVTIRLEGFSTCPFTLIVEKENKVQQQVQIEPGQLFYGSFDSVREVRIQCSESPGGTCGTSGFIQVHGCVSCCQGSDESSDES
jgi:hypothetical protein